MKILTLAIAAIVLSGCMRSTTIGPVCQQVGGCNPPPVIFIKGFILIR